MSKRYLLKSYHLTKWDDDVEVFRVEDYYRVHSVVDWSPEPKLIWVLLEADI